VGVTRGNGGETAGGGESALYFGKVISRFRIIAGELEANTAGVTLQPQKTLCRNCGICSWHPHKRKQAPPSVGSREKWHAGEEHSGLLVVEGADETETHENRRTVVIMGLNLLSTVSIAVERDDIDASILELNSLRA
jgi:hypothetical protein